MKHAVRSGEMMVSAPEEFKALVMQAVRDGGRELLWRGETYELYMDEQNAGSGDILHVVVEHKPLFAPVRSVPSPRTVHKYLAGLFNSRTNQCMVYTTEVLS